MAMKARPRPIIMEQRVIQKLGTVPLMTCVCILQLPPGFAVAEAACKNRAGGGVTVIYWSIINVPAWPFWVQRRLHLSVFVLLQLVVNSCCSLSTDRAQQSQHVRSLMNSRLYWRCWHYRTSWSSSSQWCSC